MVISGGSPTASGVVSSRRVPKTRHPAACARSASACPSPDDTPVMSIEGMRPTPSVSIHYGVSPNLARFGQRLVGIVGPRLIYPDGADQPSVKRFPRWIDLALVLSKLPNIMPRLGTRYNQIGFDYDRTQIVDQVMGSCFMVRRQTLDAVGEFDQGFWIWFEEVDYCRQAKNMGWKVMYTPAVQCIDHVGQSFGQVPSGKKQIYFRNSMLKYFKKWHPGWQYWVLKLAWPIGILITSIVEKIKK